jgi:CRISPR-associated protein Csy1
VLQQFGSTKPQNISQLNSQRHGENYLLPSCPPNWISAPVRVPLHIKSVFDRQFGRRKRVRDLIDILREFLLRAQDVNNIRIRKKRAELVNYICDELLQFTAEIHELPGGWSQHSDCRLSPEEQCWLDPWRARTDESFANLRSKSDWKDAVCQRFGNWLNARLTKGRRSLLMGEAEARAWQSTLKEELRMIHKEIDIHD